GDICADDERTLVSSVPEYNIHMDLKSDPMDEELFKNKIDSLSICLSNLFRNKTWQQYKKDLVGARNKGNRYYLIKRGVSYDQLQELKKFPIFREGQYKGGLIIETINVRKKSFRYLAARTLGYTIKGESGSVVGIEGAFDKELKGINGVRLEKKLYGGVWVQDNSDKQIDPKDGLNVVTTININIQSVAERALRKQLELNEAHHGCAILMEVESGEIKAIANLGLTKDNNSYDEIYNYAIGESTEPGSTFKLPVIMAALEDGIVDLYDSIDTKNGVKKYYNQTMYDHHPGGFGKITVKEIIEHSSNIGISTIIDEYYKKQPQKFIDRLYDMGLNRKLGLIIKGEGTPHIHGPESSAWSGVSLPWMAHGYEVEMTPLQILAFYNAIANNGKMVKPKFVNYLRNHSRIVQQFNTEVINSSICSKATIKKAKIMLEGVVENGTGKSLQTNNYKIAGKTGTAQVSIGSSGYKKDGKAEYRASFVGYFPADKPKYSCIVVISKPGKGRYYGADVAGKVFREISDKVYSSDNYLHKTLSENTDRIKKSMPASLDGKKRDFDIVLAEFNIPVSKKNIKSDWVVTSENDSIVKYENRIIKDKIIPNVKGMGARDALFLLENIGLNVEIHGRGKVKTQSVLQGTPATPGRKIILNLG
ncbi:penicillin-binding protein, partial [Bacteroidota bacterium]